MLFSASSFSQINNVAKEKIIVLPLGATEQHGPHLAVSTDTDIVTALALAAEKRMEDDIVLCPALSIGSSHHHLSFGGTISISAGTYVQLIIELVESLLHNGFRRIVLLNGHGGNINPAKQALTLLSGKYDTSLKPNIVLVTYWELAGKAFSGLPPMQSPALSHACEYETSLMMHLYPDKVFSEEMERAGRPDSNGYIPWEDDEPFKGVTMIKQTQFITSNGSSGEPQLASAEKGHYLFEKAAESFLEFLHSFKSWPFLESLKK